jgi:hypothetical protein
MQVPYNLDAAIFTFCFSTAAIQTLWSHQLLLHGCEPCRASFANCFKSVLMSLLLASEEFLSDFLPLGISLRLVPALFICPAWETLLVAIIPPV